MGNALTEEELRLKEYLSQLKTNSEKAAALGGYFIAHPKGIAEHKYEEILGPEFCHFVEMGDFNEWARTRGIRL